MSTEEATPQPSSAPINARGTRTPERAQIEVADVITSEVVAPPERFEINFAAPPSALLLSGRFMGVGIPKILVDTGASHTFINQSLIDQHESLRKAAQPAMPYVVRGFNGAEVNGHSKVTGQLTVGTLQLDLTLRIAPLGTYSMIIGWDTLVAHKTIITCHRAHLQVEVDGKTHRLFADGCAPAIDHWAPLAPDEAPVCYAQLLSPRETRDDLPASDSLRGSRHTSVMAVHAEDPGETPEGAPPTPSPPSDPGADARQSTDTGRDARLDLKRALAEEFCPIWNAPAPRNVHLETDLHVTQLRDALHDEFQDVWRAPIGINPDLRVKHRIVLTDARLETDGINAKQFRLPDTALGEIEKQVADLLAKGHIRHSESPFSAPLLVVRKKDGTWRVVVDYRKLNAVTKKDSYPMPNISSLMDKLQGSTVFSALDLASGYYQVPMAPESIEKTAFSTPSGHYEFLVMPFGLTGAPATFQRMMDYVLRGLSNVICYLDDVLVHTETMEEHLSACRQVFQRLQAHGLRIKEAKCQFGVTEVEYLGHVITGQSIRPVRSKTEAVDKWPTPTDIAAVRSFLGFCNFYRRFVLNFAQRAHALTHLTKKNVPWTWGSSEDSAFLDLKKAMTTAPVLVHPDPKRKYVVETDASRLGMGATLLQDHGHGLQPCAYFSKGLTKAQANYSPYDLEATALRAALQHWSHYLLGQHFVVRTDHLALTSLFTQPVLKQRQMRLVRDLSAFTFDIQHVAGKDNTPADALSRIVHDRWGYEKPAIVAALELHASTMTDFDALVKDIAAAAQDDPHYRALQAQGLSNDRNYSNVDGIVFRKKDGVSQLVVPNNPALRQRILEVYHDSALGGHRGQTSTYTHLSRHFWWHGLNQDVVDYVQSCPSCARNKINRQRRYTEIQPLETPKQPFESIGMDFVSGFPASDHPNAVEIELPKHHDYDCVLTVVDRFSGYTIYLPCSKHTTAPDTAILLWRHVFVHFGLPTSIVSDRDVRFTGMMWQEMNRRLTVDLKMSTAFHPQTDGAAERANQTGVETLRHYVNADMTDWPEHLPFIQYTHNTTPRADRGGLSPQELVLGYRANDPLSLLMAHNSLADDLYQPAYKLDANRQKLFRAQEALRVAVEKRREVANRSRRPPPKIEVNDMVRVRTDILNKSDGPKKGERKLAPLHDGPFRVVKVIKNADTGDVTSVELELGLDTKKHRVFNVSDVVPARDSERFPREPDSLATTPAEWKTQTGDIVANVTSILQSQFHFDAKGNGVLYVLARYHGRPAPDGTQPHGYIWVRPHNVAAERFVRTWSEKHGMSNVRFKLTAEDVKYWSQLLRAQQAAQQATQQAAPQAAQPAAPQVAQQAAPQVAQQAAPQVAPVTGPAPPVAQPGPPAAPTPPAPATPSQAQGTPAPPAAPAPALPPPPARPAGLGQAPPAEGPAPSKRRRTNSAGTAPPPPPPRQVYLVNRGPGKRRATGPVNYRQFSTTGGRAPQP